MWLRILQSGVYSGRVLAASRGLTLRPPRPHSLARQRRAGAPPGAHRIVEGLSRYSPKPPFLSISIAPAEPASAAPDLIVATRIGANVDFRAKLALGVTVGRGTTIPACSGSSARIQSVYAVATPTSMPTCAIDQPCSAILSGYGVLTVTTIKLSRLHLNAECQEGPPRP